MEKTIPYLSGVKLAIWKKLVIAMVLIALVLGVYLILRFTRDVPVDYENAEEHFKYGSIGSERASGIPYDIWKALPVLFADKLPGEGYASLGFVYEEGRDLPAGVSRRRFNGFDMVWLNCAFCHIGSVRDAPQSTPRVVAGMPANTFDFQKFIQFFFAISRDWRFTPDRILNQIEAMDGDLDFIDRLVLRWYGIYYARERILTLADRLKLFDKHPNWHPPREDGFASQPEWGPGRVDTFNGAKAFFNFPFNKLPKSELIGTADFPSIWKQAKKKGMQLHWDGNNDSVEERNKNAALGTGVTPPTIDLRGIERVEEWLLDHKAPLYPYEIDQTVVAKGAPIYKRYCANCHGASGDDFGGDYVGKVTPIEEIGTDRHRLDSYTFEVSANQGILYAGYPWRYKHFRKTFGYANMPLDGLWLRAPYLHNGSVPTARALLEPSANRPKVFYRGNDVYDPVNLGFVSDVAGQNGRTFFQFDTSLPGNSNKGHEGPRYGTTLSAEEKDALVEYMKNF